MVSKSTYSQGTYLLPRDSVLDVVYCVEEGLEGTLEWLPARAFKLEPGVSVAGAACEDEGGREGGRGEIPFFCHSILDVINCVEEEKDSKRPLFSKARVACAEREGRREGGREGGQGLHTCQDGA